MFDPGLMVPPSIITMLPELPDMLISLRTMVSVARIVTVAPSPTVIEPIFPDKSITPLISFPVSFSVPKVLVQLQLDEIVPPEFVH